MALWRTDSSVSWPTWNSGCAEGAAATSEFEWFRFACPPRMGTRVVSVASKPGFSGSHPRFRTSLFSLSSMMASAAAFSMSMGCALPSAAPAAVPPPSEAEMSMASKMAALASTSIAGNRASGEREGGALQLGQKNGVNPTSCPGKRWGPRRTHPYRCPRAPLRP